MTDKLAALPDTDFISIWNSAASLDEATTKVRAVVGTPCPRWAVMARASGLRGAGVEVRRLTAAGRSAGPGLAPVGPSA